MIKQTGCIVLALFMMAQQVNAQQPPRLLVSGKKTYTISFQLTSYNNLSVPAVLNNTDTLHLMFHTAASWVTLTEEAVKKITSWHVDRTDSVKTWGGDAASRFSKNNTLQMQGMKWDSVPVWEDKFSGQFTDGKFGPDLFVNKVIAIDFDKNQLTVSTTLPGNIKQYEKLKLVYEHDMLFIEARCNTGDSTITNKFLVHSGYGGAILFDDQFASDNRLADQLRVIDVKELKDAFGNVLKIKKAILPGFTIGNTTLENVPAGFFQGTIGRQKMSVIGGDLLKRFNIVIDAQRQFIYLKANELKSTSYITS